MCIRDSYNTMGVLYRLDINQPDLSSSKIIIDSIDGTLDPFLCACLLYTSDAADERSSVDLGGRRIIKKKNQYCLLYTPDSYDIM